MLIIINLINYVKNYIIIVLALMNLYVSAMNTQIMYLSILLDYDHT